jgi:hypothetical protein
MTMTPKLLILCSGALVAALGATTTAEAQPAWCNQPDAGRVSGDYLNDAITKTDNDGFMSLIGVLCDPRRQEGRGAEVEAARQRWARALQMTEEDWADARVWAGNRKVWDRYFYLDWRGTGTTGRAQLAWSELGPLDQYAVMHHGMGSDYDGESNDAAYVADALGDKLTEVGRLGFISATCFERKMNVLALARCVGDLAALDRNKLLTELRADKSYSGFERTIVRLRLHEIEQRGHELDEQVKKWKAKDPAYEKLFEIAEQQRKLWAEYRKTHAALLDLVLAMEDARSTRSRKRYEGCDARTWEAWKAAVGAMPQSSFSEVVIEENDIFGRYADVAVGVIIRDPAGYLASLALILCHEHDENRDGLVEKLSRIYQIWPGTRGPRTSLHSALLLAGLELDDRDAKLELPGIQRNYKKKNSGYGTWFATFDAAKPAKDGDTVTLSWGAKAEKYPQCVDMRTSKRISRIDANGNVQYERTCMKYKDVVSTQTRNPITVRSRYAAGLKKGMVVAVVGNDVPFLVWPKGGKTLTHIAGVPLAK